MSIVQQFRDKVQGYEGYANAWIVSKRVALLTHLAAAAIGAVLGWKLH